MRVRPPDRVPLPAAVHPRAAGPPDSLHPQVGWPLSFRAFFEFRKIGKLQILTNSRKIFLALTNFARTWSREKFMNKNFTHKNGNFSQDSTDDGS
jgi:hypothetical protein